MQPALVEAPWTWTEFWAAVGKFLVITREILSMLRNVCDLICTASAWMSPKKKIVFYLL
jgi:hypothetical protein